MHYVCRRAAEEERDATLADALFSEYILDDYCLFYWSALCCKSSSWLFLCYYSCFDSFKVLGFMNMNGMRKFMTSPWCTCLILSVSSDAWNLVSEDSTPGCSARQLMKFSSRCSRSPTVRTSSLLFSPFSDHLSSLPLTVVLMLVHDLRFWRPLF